MSKQAKREKSKAKKIIDWIIIGVFGALVVAVGTLLIIGNSTKGSNHNVPNFGGHQIMVVLTDSMEPEYKVGTAIFVDKVNASTLGEKDDVTFYYPAWKSYMDNPVVTHRVKRIEINEEIPYGQGRYSITCSGINTNSGNAEKTSGGSTRDCTKQEQTFTEKELMGKVMGQSQFVGGVYNFVTSPWGLVVLLFIPCGYLIVSNVIDIYKATKEGEEATETSIAASSEGASSNVVSSLNELSEEDRERLKKELLNKMMEDKQNGSK